MSAGDIHNNEATDDRGGGIFSFGPVTMTGGSIRSNTAQLEGGGIYTSIANLSNMTLSNNTSQTEGGGIFADIVTTQGTTITGNKSAGSGGGITQPTNSKYIVWDYY